MMGELSNLNEWPQESVLWDSAKSWNNVAQNNHLTAWIKILGHHIYTYISGMFNSIISVAQCKVNLLNRVQVLLHAIVYTLKFVLIQ